jgi:hypothetical protein
MWRRRRGVGGRPPLLAALLASLWPGAHRVEGGAQLTAGYDIRPPGGAGWQGLSLPARLQLRGRFHSGGSSLILLTLWLWLH